MIQLTIAIPTYNRAGPLRSLLTCLSAQDEISAAQILVSDNGSTDSTQLVVQEFSSRLRIKSERFESNKGFDVNYLNCVKTAEGLYIWIIGDDDNLTEGAVASVLTSIRNKNPDILVCNGGDNRPQGIVPRITERIDELRTIPQLMKKVGWHLCWIGTCVVKRELYRPDLLKIDDFNAFVHIPLIVRSLPPKFLGIFVDRVLIHTTVNNSGYFKDPIVLVETFGKKLFDTLECLGIRPEDRAVQRAIVRSFHERLCMFSFRDFLSFRRLSTNFNVARFLSRIVYYYRVNPTSPLFVVFFAIPVCLLKAIFSALRVIRRLIDRSASLA